MTARHVAAPYVVLGGGLAGMAAALPLGEKCVVLEAADRAGGLVQSHNYDGYWFDTVLHLMHVGDHETLRRIQGWLGDVLQPIDRVAWVEMPFGRVRYPFQQNLSALPLDLAVACLDDMARAVYQHARQDGAADNLHQRFLDLFGQSLCDLFFYPYNEKLWKRPLDTLPAGGLAWTIPNPDFREVLRGTLATNINDRSYNSDAWYPQPPAGAPLRGMELLSAAMAARVSHLKVRCRVSQLDPDRRHVLAATPDGVLRCDWEEGAVSTIPLPRLAEMTIGLPGSLLKAAARLKHMRVIYFAFRVQGPRPEDRGHWHYYPDPTVSFNRLVYMHRFDPLSAPTDGWGVMAEITETADAPPGDRSVLQSQVVADLDSTGALPDDCTIVGCHVLESEYGYVVFDDAREEAVCRLEEYFHSKGIVLLGRYGRWDYYSMSQVLRQGHDWALAALRRHGWTGRL
jgi:protoporphyrinogen oxidase